MRSLALASMSLLILAPAIPAQSTSAGRAGPRTLLPRALEIALARSAAPPSVSDSARIYVLTVNGYVIADSGRIGAACYVSRSWPESIEPHCFDPEGASTIMPMEMRRVELRQQGRNSDEVEREIAEGLASGRFRLPARPAMSYMMSCGQRLISDEGELAGKWRPHLMIYFPYLTEASMGFAQGSDIRAAIVVDPGKSASNIMIPVPEFITPVEPASCSS